PVSSSMRPAPPRPPLLPYTTLFRSAAQVRAKVARARDAFRPWSKLDPEDRAVFLSHFAEILRKHKNDYAPTMTMEMGKVIRESLDRKSTRLNSSHLVISYAVFCLKK